MDVNDDPRYPNIGDVIGCSDGDIGVVLRTYFDDDKLMVEVVWSVANRTLTDPWRAKDFETIDDMFHIMSRA
jgi:hypothetical protein